MPAQTKDDVVKQILLQKVKETQAAAKAQAEDSAESLREAREMIEILHQQVIDATQPPFVVGLVLQNIVTPLPDPDPENAGELIPTDCVRVASGSGDMLVLKPKTIGNVNIGDYVTVHMGSRNIISKIDKKDVHATGKTAVVDHVIDKDRCQISLSDGKYVVYVNSEKVEDGQEVLVDQSLSLVLFAIPKDDKKYQPEAFENIDWSQVGGQEQAKVEIYESLEVPYKFPDLFKAYGKKPIRGIVLSGPPGCGKTIFGKAIATSLRKKNINNFFYVKSPELLSKWVGETEASIRNVFLSANNVATKYDMFSVIFFDEADALMGKRGSGISSDIEKTIVPTFLTEMDGIATSRVIVILATNRPDRLDPAVVRPGRIDLKIKIARPSKEDSKKIFEIYLKKTPLQGDLKDLVESATDDLFSQDLMLAELVCRSGPNIKLLLSSLVSGAMICSIVDHATSIALREDIANNKKKCSGVNRNHLHQAIERVFFDYLDIDHKDDIKELALDLKQEVAQVIKFRPS